MGNFLSDINKLYRKTGLFNRIWRYLAKEDSMNMNAKAESQIQLENMKVIITSNFIVFHTQIGSIIPITNLSIFIEFRVSLHRYIRYTIPFIIQEILVYQQIITKM